MEFRHIGTPKKRAEFLRKFLGIFFLVISLLCLVSSMALANPSTGAKKGTGLSPTLHLHNAGDPAQGFLEMYRVLFNSKSLLLPGVDAAYGPGEREVQNENVLLLTQWKDNGGKLNSATMPLNPHVDVPGYKTKSHMFMKPSKHPAPTLLLIEERSNNGRLYLGLLSLTIPW